MFKNPGFLAAMLTVAALTACGSSDNDDDNDNDRTPSFTELAARNRLMEVRVNAMDETATLPTAGSATYEGTGAFDIGANGSTDMLADLTLEADFAKSEVGGGFSNFVEADGDRVGGDLTIADSVVNGNTFDANARGTLNNGTAQDVNVDMAGTFRGDDADAILGMMDGTIGSDVLGGDFVATKK